jgi:hypothetical protein
LFFASNRMVYILSFAIKVVDPTSDPVATTLGNVVVGEPIKGERSINHLLLAP